MTHDRSVRDGKVGAWTLVWLSGISGIITAWILATILIVQTPIAPIVAVGYWIFATLLAIPLGLLAGLMSLGAGLGLWWLVRRVAGPKSLFTAAAAMFGVLAAGTGVAGLVVYGAISELVPYLWVAITAAILGGLALSIWSIKFASGPERVGATSPRRTSPL